MKMTQAEVDAYNRRHGFIQIKPEAVETESELHAAILAECRRRGWLVIHSRMDKRSHTACGVPDFVIWTDTRWSPLLIEAKRRQGKLTPAQQAWHAHAAKLSITVHVVRNMTEFLALL